MNIKRSLFAVWQEYQGLGLLGGMGHAADLPRQIFIYLISHILPVDLIRYVSTFTALLAGSIGAYVLTKYLILNTKIPALLAGIFYTLNIATIQTFYAPFEAFIYHFGVLPWLLLASILFLERPDLKRTVFLVLVLLLSAPASYIPTLFVVYVLAISIYILTNLILNSNRLSYLIKTVKLFAVIILVNAFWLLPFLYFTINNAHVNVNSKINQMGTDTIFLQNKEFGTLLDTALLRGFWFNNVDPNFLGDFDYMLSPWRAHFDNPLVPASGLALFAIILIGAISVLAKIRKNKSSMVTCRLSLVVLFLFSFTMLAIDTPIFSQINELFRKIPLFEQAFRFPFTKFNSLAALTYSIMLVFGITFLTERIMKHESRIMGFVNYSLFVIPAFLIVLIAFPVFKGHLFYEKVRINIPQEYFDTFSFFQQQDPNTRIANLPQPTFWGWTFYRWGYGGSGFLWYGIRQPILDRAFDVWSKTSENYYYELTQALYSEDKKAFENVLNKYQISWILLDKNVIYPHSPKSLFYDKTENLIESIPGISQARKFGNIKIYKVDLKDKPRSFVFAAGANLPLVETPFWKSQDFAYQKFGNYISTNCQLSRQGRGSGGNCQLLPFGSLFSQKTSRQKDFTLLNKAEAVVIEKNITLPADSFINVPPFLELERIVPFEIKRIKEYGGTDRILANIRTPKILVNGQVVWEQARTIPLFSIPKTAVFPIEINVNGLLKITVTNDARGILGTTFLTVAESNWVTAAGENFNAQANIKGETIERLFENVPTGIGITKGTHKLSIEMPKINDRYLSLNEKGIEAESKNCGPLVSEKGARKETAFNNTALNIYTKNASLCYAFHSDTLFHDTGFALFPKTKNVSGKPLHFWVLNVDQNISPINVYLLEGDSFIMPAMGENGTGYSFHFDNISIGREEARNILFGIEVYPMPARFISNISIGLNDQVKSLIGGIYEVSHPNESFYEVKISDSAANSVLALSQSYDPGWKAYVIPTNDERITNTLQLALPFVFGSEIKEHVELNSWANAWLLPQSSIVNGQSSIVIVYIPQYLQYAGFAVLIITFALISFKFAVSKLKG
jgi:hypothetical protein